MKTKLEQLMTEANHTFDSIHHSSSLHAAVYALHHLKSGKIYVGRTGVLYYRMRQHKSKLKLGKHENLPIQTAYNEDPEFRIAYVKVDSWNEAIAVEQDAIEYVMTTNTAFNIAEDSEKPALGLKLSEEHNRVRQEGSDKYWRSEEGQKSASDHAKRLWSNTSYVEKQKGVWRNLPQEEKDRINNMRAKATERRMQDPEFQRKLKEAAVKRSQSPGVLAALEKRKRPVIIGGVRYSSIREAAAAEKVSGTQISRRISSPNHPDCFFASEDSVIVER